MSRYVDPLLLFRVIGDVVDPFIPSATMAIYFGSKRVTNGCDIKPSMATFTPRIVINGDHDQLYTLVMIDPDAPSPSEPTLREFVHWIVTNIPGNASPEQGNEVVTYLGPRPPIGIHRYIFVLFQQRGRMGFIGPPLYRTNFNTRTFAYQLGLGLPVAGVVFNAKKEQRIKKGGKDKDVNSSKDGDVNSSKDGDVNGSKDEGDVDGSKDEGVVNG